MSTTLQQQGSNISDLTTFKVYFPYNNSLIQLKFKDGSMRVEEVIIKAIDILSDTYMIKLNPNHIHYALFPATKKGQKIPDSIEISHGTRIQAVGCRKFYLEYLNLVKKSISTQINLEVKYGYEKKPRREMVGCCGIFPFRNK